MSGITRIVTIATALSTLILSTSATYAAIAAEWDFRTNEDMITAGGTGSADSTLRNNAFVNTGPAVPYAGAHAKLRNGYLDTNRFLGIDPDSGAVGAGLTSSDQWEDYYGTTAFTDGTVVMAFKPYMNAAQRVTYLSHKVQTGDNGQIWLFSEHFPGNASNDTLHLRVGNDNNTASLGGFDFDSSRWYVAIATWDVGGSLEVYLREIGTGTPVLSATDSGPVANATGTLTDIISVGVRKGVFAPGYSEAGDAQIAYFLLNDQYSNSAAATAIFAQLIPEPTGAVTLVGAGALAMLRRRSRRS